MVLYTLIWLVILGAIVCAATDWGARLFMKCLAVILRLPAIRKTDGNSGDFL